MFHIVVCDDEEYFRNREKKLIEEYMKNRGLACQTSSRLDKRCWRRQNPSSSMM